ncbi:MAG: DUF4178 domain-containing protein [Leptospiraceae bacterium]|nr:DUF4178 domain-containing protein [Leptospiraceae bacterium]
MEFSCPSCGAPIQFKSRFSFYGVCSYCNSTLVRKDKSVEALGKISDMLQDLSPIQIGSTGILKDKKFTVLGKQKISYPEGVWNEYFLGFGDESTAWLSESQGEYMVSKLIDSVSIPEKNDVHPGGSLTIDKIKYNVIDKRKVVCVGILGELPEQILVGEKFVSVDLISGVSQFANIGYFIDGKKFFKGSYYEFEDFQFQNLRKIDGWD